LNSSATKYKYENGRRYHAFKEGSYLLPNDEKENDRLDLLHHICTLRLEDRLHLAPIGTHPQRILDLGTGTGIWAIEMGDAYPSATILGNDLSPIQPSMVPPNVKFEIDDIENEWVFQTPFDFIHSRYLIAAIANWPKLVEQTFKHTKPGGYVEFLDSTMQLYSDDGSLPADSAINRWCSELIRGTALLGREPQPGPLLEGWIRNAGFENVHVRKIKLPVGTWPKDKRLKEVGAFNLMQFLDGLESMTLAIFTRALGWSNDEITAFLVDLRKEFKNRNYHTQYDGYVVWAQKPTGAT
jgi:SAM-dependent methyltransferase